MSRGFKIFLFLLISLVAFSLYQGRESRLRRILDGFYGHVVEDPGERSEKPWRRVLEDYEIVNPVEGPLSIDGEQDRIVVEIQPSLLPIDLALPGDFPGGDVEEPGLAHLPEGNVDDGESPEEVAIADGDPEPGDDAGEAEPEPGPVPPSEEPDPEPGGDATRDYDAVEHLVLQDERLWIIARHYLGSGVRYKDIMAWNGLKSEAIRAGMRLEIRVPRRKPGGGVQPTPDPGGGGRPVAKKHVHRVREGETLASIARRYYRGNGDQWERIHRHNKTKIRDPDHLPLGLRLEIPEPLGGIEDEERRS